MTDVIDEADHPFVIRLMQSKDWPKIDAIIRHLRVRAPLTVPTSELASVIDRKKSYVYGLVKLARRYLAASSGDVIANIRGVGYRITKQPRALLFESIKSGNRADGHLGSEIKNFRAINRANLTSTEDVELYVAQQARIRLGEARLAITADVAPAMRRLEQNLALEATAARDAKTPWGDLGIDDPDETSN